MPEGDTVHLAARRLDEALAGQILTGTDFRVPRFATADLTGRLVENVVARGKHLLMRIGDDLTLHTHFKMEGEWHIYRRGERWRGAGFQVRVILETDPWVAVGFRLGVVELLSRDEERSAVGYLGPDVLGPDWDPEEVVRRILQHPDAPIGEVVVDQRVIAGPGNIYRNEICFLRGVHPRAPVGEVADIAGLVGLMKQLMEANRTTGMQTTTGDARPGRDKWVYGREGRPCRRCGTAIEKLSDSERVTYVCPRCQPLGPQASPGTRGGQIPKGTEGMPGMSGPSKR